MREPEQGIMIPCVDCTVLELKRDACPTCNGSRSHFQPARMADHGIQRSMGEEAYVRYQELKKGEEWQEQAAWARSALQSTIIYGGGFAAGFLKTNLPEDPEVAAKLTQAVQTRLKEFYFEARRRIVP